MALLLDTHIWLWSLLDPARLLASTTIKLPHRDPADRLIAASAKAFDLTLITADRRLIACDDVEVLVA